MLLSEGGKRNGWMPKKKTNKKPTTTITLKNQDIVLYRIVHGKVRL